MSPFVISLSYPSEAWYSIARSFSATPQRWHELSSRVIKGGKEEQLWEIEKPEGREARWLGVRLVVLMRGRMDSEQPGLDMTVSSYNGTLCQRPEAMQSS